jgi:hypothetical protein
VARNRIPTILQAASPGHWGVAFPAKVAQVMPKQEHNPALHQVQGSCQCHDLLGSQSWKLVVGQFAAHRSATRSEHFLRTRTGLIMIDIDERRHFLPLAS